jgi:hypothetical protein
MSVTIVFFSTACGDDAAVAPDGGGDGSVPVCTSDALLEAGDPDGHPEPLGVAPGEARAGRVEAAELPADPAGLATWAPGDFVLANEHVAVVIEDVGLSDGYDVYGGKIVGMFQVRDGALVDAADFNEVSTAIGRFTFDPSSVTVLSDGADGGAAIVRAIGTLAPVPFIDPIIRGLIPGEYDDIEVAVDHVLEPGAHHVDIRYTFHSERPFDARVQQAIHFFVQYKRMPAWTPVAGFEVSTGMGAVPYIAFVEDGATSFGWASPDGDLEPFIDISGVIVFAAPSFQIPACALSERDYARIYIGGPGLDGVVAARAAAEGEPIRAITATVTDPAGAPAAGVRVHATGEGGMHLTRATSGEDGTAVLHVPMDAAVELHAYRRGEEVAGPVTVAAGATTAELALAGGGFIHVLATDVTSTEGLPVRVQVTAVGDRPSVPGGFGERFPADGRLHVELPVDGDVTLPVPAGRHRVIVSRGYEYEVVSEEVDVAAGATVEVAAVLERVVDTTGVMCGDFHIHTHRSPDSEDDARLKVLGALADGLEIPVRSEHEWIADFEPIIADLGAAQWAFGVGSLELTTFAWGHFGVFPLDPLPDVPNTGAFDWVGKTPPEVFGEVRAREGSSGEPAIIINHPRSSVGGLGAIGAYFDAAGYDPDTTMLETPEYWDEGFTLVEVFNDSSFDANFDRTVRDWFSFLSSGRRVYAVGSSDSHAISRSPVGYPRTCISVGTDDAEALRSMGAAHLRDTMLDGHFGVSGGIYVDAVARGGASQGDEVSGSAATELVAVTVQAASWIDADTLRVYVDGMLVETIALDETTIDPLNPVIRFQNDVSVPVASAATPSWAVFVASGDAELAPIHPGRLPFGVTNPIFFSR